MNKWKIQCKHQWLWNNMTALSVHVHSAKLVTMFWQNVKKKLSLCKASYFLMHTCRTTLVPQAPRWIHLSHFPECCKRAPCIFTHPNCLAILCQWPPCKFYKTTYLLPQHICLVMKTNVSRTPFPFCTQQSWLLCAKKEMVSLVRLLRHSTKRQKTRQYCLIAWSMDFCNFFVRW